MTAALIELRGLCKHFGGVHAVRDVGLELRAGEAVGLLGHNGAGKSTLIKLLSGALVRDDGEILIDGRTVRLQDPRDAREFGIETIYQDLALADNLDAPANLFLGREILTKWGLLDHRAMERVARDVIGQVNSNFEAFRTPVCHLSGGQRQAIAIGRAIHFGARKGKAGYEERFDILPDGRIDRHDLAAFRFNLLEVERARRLREFESEHQSEESTP